MSKVISISNQKGGVAKTTTCLNLSAALAKQPNKTFPERLNRILMIDCDSQANLVESVGDIPDDAKFEGNSVCDLFRKKAADGFDPLDLVYEVDSMPKSQIYLIPSTMELSAVNGQLFMDKSGLLTFVENVKILREYFDYIFIDCAPALDNLLLGPLLAADEVIIPTKPERLSMSGMHYLFDTINGVINSKSEAKNPDLKITGLIATMYRSVSKEHNEMITIMQNEKPYSKYPLLGVVPLSTMVTKSIAQGRAVVDTNPSCKPSKAYIDIAAKL